MSSSPEVARSGSDSLVQDAGAVADNARPASATEALVRPKALVADDDAIGRTLLTTLLTKWGYDVITALDGDEALKVLQSQDGVQLAVLDWMMDGTNGIEVCQRIRAIPDLPYVYLILLTSRDQQADRIEGLHAGADDYLTKPFDPLELRARLETGRRICLQRALNESEMRFREAIEYSGVGMTLTDIQGNWLQVNQAFADFFGYSKEEILRLTIREISHPEDLEPSWELVRRLVAGELKNFQLEKRYIHKSGRMIWGLLTVSLVKGQNGVATQMVAQVQDITKIKTAEKAMQESEALFRAIAENADELIAVTDPQGTVLYTSPAYEKHLGYQLGELHGSNILGHLHPEDHELVQRRTKEAIATGDSNNVQVRLRHKNGTWRTVDGHGGIIRNAQGRVEKLVATSRIIDDWLAAQEVLQEREGQLQLILDSTAEAIYGIDRLGNCTFCNDSFLRLLGYHTVDEVLGKNGHQLWHHSRADGSHYPVEECPINLAIHQEIGTHVETEVLWRADGSSFPAEYWSHPVWKNGGIVGGVVTFIDITARKRAETNLREAHDESELVINSVPSILMGLDAGGHITQWNMAAETAFDLTKSDVHGKHLLQCGIKWLDTNIEAEIASWLAMTVCTRYDNVRFQKGKESRLLGITITPFNVSNGKSGGMLIVGADTTERKVFEEQLRQSQKLEAIGQLAAGIAHEINTPIQYVGDNTTFLKDSWAAISQLLAEASKVRSETVSGLLSEATRASFERTWQEADLDYLQSEIPRAIEQSLEGVGRVARIVRAMKEFSHPGTEEKRAIDINRAIETTLTVASNEWKYVANVRTVFAEDLPMVPCLAGEFNQVVLNLVINSSHAIADKVGDGSKGKGEITIITRREDDWAEISIRDTGAGIPENIKSRIFEPFFTTKDVGRGTGQGLSLAHAVIVKKHGGKIWFESEPGKGTTFFIRLPLNQNAPVK
jgi:PAS domain S-box-containing protein